MSGVDLVTLASLLGHSKIQMVMRYAHLSQEHQFEAVRKLEQFTARKGLNTRETKFLCIPKNCRRCDYRL